MNEPIFFAAQADSPLITLLDAWFKLEPWV
jgi:hypothetical protein